MTYHVKCPISKKTFDFESVIETRRFVYAMMRKYPDCKETIQIKDGKKLYGKMWRTGKNIHYRSKGARTVRTISETGNIRR